MTIYPSFDHYLPYPEIFNNDFYFAVIAAFAKLNESTSANNSIWAGIQYIFLQNILLQHQPLSN